MSKEPKGKIIVALDVDTLVEARVLIDKLADKVDIFKVGSQLFTACGPAAVRFIQARGKEVFLDLKFHDIPNTVANAVKTSVGLSLAVERSMEDYDKEKHKDKGLHMFTVHTCGGEEMLKSAVDAAYKTSQETGAKRPKVVGVTVLTSEIKVDNMLSLVLQRAELAYKCGLDGVVASCHEAKMIRREFGKDFVIVTPGIRPQGSDVQDQKRVATPKEAIANGSNYLVIGRPIVKADDPRLAAENILKEIENA